MANLLTRKKSKYWYAVFLDDVGKKVWRSTKIVAKASTRREAQKVADAFEDAGTKAATVRQLRATIDELQKRISGEELRSLSFKQHSENWLSEKKGEVAHSTYSSYSATVEQFTLYLGDRAESDMNVLRKADMIGYRTEVSKKVSATTTNGKIKVMRMIFNQAEEEGLLLENPIKFVKNLKRQKNPVEKRVFTVAELNTVLDFADDGWRSMIMFGYYTGQRLGDIARLKWSQVDLESGKIHLVTAKTNNTLNICMHKDLVAFLKESPTPIGRDMYVHPRAQEFLVKAKGHSTTLSNQFTKMLEHVGLREKTTHEKTKNGRNAERATKPLSFHCLRHTLVTAMHEAGVPPAAVEQFVGHECTAINRVYTHMGDKALRDAANALPTLKCG